MDNVERKKLWRKKKGAVKELFRKYGIKDFEDSLLEQQLSNKELQKEIWDLGFSMIAFHVCVFDETTRTYPIRSLSINRCENTHPCQECVSPEARDIAEIYSDELHDRLPEDQIQSARYLWLRVDRQNWTPDDFNFTVEPCNVAHRFDNWTWGASRLVGKNKEGELVAGYAVDKDGNIVAG